MIPRDLADADRPRSAHRHKIFVPTQMHLQSGDVRAHLINISLSGALAHAATVPQPGETIQVAIGETRVAARVRWTDGPRFGLAFVTPLAPALLQQLLGDS